MAAGTLLVLGAGFLVANLRLLREYLRFVRRRGHALLSWSSPPPPYYGTQLLIGVVVGLLFVYKIVANRPAFGESMMFLYYAWLMPLSLRINRGFYEDGIWADSTFIPYHEVGGLAWRESNDQAWLIVITRMRNLGRRLAVPLEHYGAARKLLREKIGSHEIQFQDSGLDLGAHDDRDDA